MKTNGQRASFRVLGASERGAGWIALPERVALASLVALSLLAWSALASPEHARAAGNPRLVFVAPVYPGQNNGFAEGPVGTAVTVKGSGWTPPDNTPNSQPVVVSLADEQQDTPGRPGSACQNGAPHIILPLVDSGVRLIATATLPFIFSGLLRPGQRGIHTGPVGSKGIQYQWGSVSSR